MHASIAHLDDERCMPRLFAMDESPIWVIVHECKLSSSLARQVRGTFWPVASLTPHERHPDVNPPR